MLARGDTSPAPNLRNPPGQFHLPACRRPSMLAKDTFIFLNQSQTLESVGWNCTAPKDLVSRLWRYNLHYFEDLNAFNASKRSHWHSDLMCCWVKDNPPCKGVGWEPYPTSLRIVNWIKWYGKGNALSENCVESLAVQARWLAKRLEWHLLGNHLFANAKALIHAGCFFSGDEAEYWLERGLDIISQQLHVQMLSDGGHFELSTMYHAIFVEDLLDLLNLANFYPGAISEQNRLLWIDAVSRALQWLMGMIHPDGEIAYFNDAAVAVAPSPKELVKFANRLGLHSEQATNRLTHFAESGYIRLGSDKAVVFADVGRVGPDYQPGHAHADTLSFELSLHDHRVFVNSGISEYGSGPNRQFERGTEAHNTVVVNHRNSADVWSGFRVGRRGMPKDLIITETSNLVVVSCSHDGYKWLPGRPIHRRTWAFSEGQLVISDQIDGYCETADAYLHLHPSISISSISERVWLLELPGGKLTLVEVEIGDSELIPSYYAPEFGKRLKSWTLKLGLEKLCSCVRITWDYGEQKENHASFWDPSRSD